MHFLQIVEKERIRTY